MNRLRRIQRLEQARDQAPTPRRFPTPEELDAMTPQELVDLYFSKKDAPFDRAALDRARREWRGRDAEETIAYYRQFIRGEAA